MNNHGALLICSAPFHPPLVADLFYHSVQLLYALGTHVPAAERDDVPYAPAEHTGLVILAKNNVFSFNIYLKRVFLLYIHRASYLNGQDNAPKLIDLAYHTGGFHDSSLLVYICSALRADLYY